MSNMTHDLLVHGTAPAKAGDKVEVERYLDWLLRLNPSEREKIEAFHWLADLSDDPVIKRNYIDDVLARNPGDARARKKLAILNGELHPDDIIDPGQLEIDRKTEPAHSDPRRFTYLNGGAKFKIPRNLLSGSCLSRVHRIKLVIFLTASGHPPILPNPIKSLQH